MMELAGLAFVVIGLYVLYHVIRLGVRDGIRAARADESEGVTSEGPRPGSDSAGSPAG